MRMRTALLALTTIALLGAGCTAGEKNPTPAPAVADHDCTPTYEIMGAVSRWRVAGYTPAAYATPINEDVLRYDDGLVAGSGAGGPMSAARILELAQDELNAASFGALEPLEGEPAAPWRALDLADADARAIDLYLEGTILRFDGAEPAASPSAAPSTSPSATPAPTASPKGSPSPSASPTEPEKDGTEMPTGPRFYALVVIPTIDVEVRVGRCETDGDGEFLAYGTVSVLAFDRRVDETRVVRIDCDEPLTSEEMKLGEPYLGLDPADLARIHASACATLSA